MRLLAIFIPDFPIVKPANSKKSDTKDPRHGRKWSKIIIDTFNYVTNNNEELKSEIKDIILKSWNINPNTSKILVEAQRRGRTSYNNSTVALNYFGFSFPKLNDLNNYIYNFFNFKPFAAVDNIRDVLKSHLPEIDYFVKLYIKPSKKDIDSNRQSYGILYYFPLFLTIAMSITGFINNNIFEKDSILAPDPNQIAMAFGSDRCDLGNNLGCYGISGIVKGGIGDNGASHATTSCIIFGRFKDDAKSLTQLYRVTNYSNEMSALNRFPVIITFVKYIEQDGIIKHRYTHSCVLAFNETHHTQLNNKLIKDEKKLKEQWLIDNPDQKVEHPAHWSLETGSNYDGYIGKRRGRMGMKDCTSERSTRDKKNHVNWIQSFDKYLYHLQHDTYKPEWLAFKGYNKPIENGITTESKENVVAKAIDNLCARSLGSTLQTIELPYVSEIQFGQSMFKGFYIDS